MKKRIEFNKEAREKLKKGVDVLANAVKVTLGPNGKNVILGNPFGNSHITKDGVTVAKQVFVDDSIENIGVQAVKQVASKTAKEAGDGTTTATVLAQEIMTLGLEAVNNGSNAMDLKRGMDKATNAVVRHLKNISKEISNNKEIKNVATISSNNDEEIGKVIAEAMESVNNTGTISVAESESPDTYIKNMEGYEFPQGFLTPYFISNNKRGVAELNNPFILITDQSITNVRDMQEIMVEMFKVPEKRDILIIVGGMEGEALGTLVENHKENKKGINICVVQAPYIGSNRLEALTDIGIMTGGKAFSDKTGHKTDAAKLEHLGQCKKIIVGERSTIIVGGSGSKGFIDSRISEIDEAIKSVKADKLKAILQERRDRMGMSQAIIHIGASTSMEMEEKKDRYDDAICATRSAVEEGIVPGGGVALIRCSGVLDKIVYKNRDEKIGGDIIKKALLSPLRTIIENAEGKNKLFFGKDKFSKVLKKVKSTNNYSFGYNAKTGKFEDLVETGVIDPTKVTRNAIENASSIASLLITTECVIADESMLNQ